MKTLTKAGIPLTLLCAAAFNNAANVDTVPGGHDRAKLAERTQAIGGTIARMCADRAPAMVIDHFRIKKNVLGPHYEHAAKNDIDGDGVPEGAHGDIVGAVMDMSGKPYIAYDAGAENRTVMDDPPMFNGLVDRIRSGAVPKPAFINYSFQYAYSFKAFNKLGYLHDFTPDNIGSRRGEALETALKDPMFGQYAAAFFQAFKKLEAMNIPVVIAAGNNTGEDGEFNFLSLLPGTVTVGALQPDRKTVSPYSNETTLIDAYRPGHVFFRAVAGGIDIDHDGKPHFASRDLSREPAAATILEGRKLDDVLKTIPESFKAAADVDEGKKLMRQASGMYLAKETDEYFTFLKSHMPASSTPAQKKIRKLEGEYVYYPFGVSFHVDDDGILHYRPAGIDDKTLVKDDFGTSYAAPRICQTQYGEPLHPL